MKKYSFFFLLILLSSIASAQALPQTVNQTVNTIAASEYTFYVGHIDDLHTVRVSLHCNDGSCNGSMLLVESGILFQLKGMEQNGMLYLEEIDAQKQVSGYIKAKREGQTIKGEWSNVIGDIGAQLHLQQVASENAPLHPRTSKWIHQYRGIILWDEVDMLVHHYGQNQLTGSIYYRTQDEYKTLSGWIDDQNQLHISIQNKGGLEEGTLVSNSYKNQDICAKFTDTSGKRHYASFELEHKIPIKHIQYADYVTSYEVLLPQHSNSFFNQWASDYVQTWVNRCRTQVQTIREHYPDCTPAARSTERAYVWFEIEDISTDWVVGQFFFSSTWQDQTISKPINFNLQIGKPILWKQVLKKESVEFQQAKKSYIQQKIRQNPHYLDNEFRSWVSKSEFPIFNIQEHGIQFSTQYHEVYGQAQVTIPYDKLKPFLKNNTVLQQFF